MSSAYSISASTAEVTGRFGIAESPAYQPNFNARPSQLLPVITNTGRQGLSFFYWGTSPAWAKNKPIGEKIIHLQAEVLADKPVYRRKLAERRCLVPADGFYGWKHVGKKTMVPHRFILQSKSLFAMAGIWEEYEDENGEQLHTFMIITCAANDLVIPIQERMPVILPREAEDSWLTPSSSMDLITLLKPYDASLMDAYTVTPRINSPEANDVSLLIPTPPSDQFGNLTLFD
jgi:putative SOS response-associated peptidase YedK